MVAVDILILGKIPDIFIFGEYHIAGIRGKLVHDNTEQGSFTGSVIADECGFFSVFYMETGILKDHLFAKGFADVLT